MFRWLSGLTLLLLATCSRSTDAPSVIRLVDVFDSANVEGSFDARPSPGRTEWRFDGGNNGWTALSGVTGLDVRDERLSGRAETELRCFMSREPRDSTTPTPYMRSKYDSSFQGR